MNIFCKNCCFWRKIRDEDATVKDAIWLGAHGECKAIHIYSQKRMAWLYSTVTYADEEIRTSYDIKEDKQGNELVSDSSLITMGDFGCSAWKPKE